MRIDVRLVMRWMMTTEHVVNSIRLYQADNVAHLALYLHGQQRQNVGSISRSHTGYRISAAASKQEAEEHHYGVPHFSFFLSPSLVLHLLDLPLLLFPLRGGSGVGGLLGGDEVLLPLALPLLLAGLLALEAVFLGGALLGLAADVVLAGLELAVDLARLRRVGERRVRLLALVRELVRHAPVAQAALLVVR